MICSLTYYIRSLYIQGLLICKECVCVECSDIPNTFTCLSASLSKLILSIVSVSCEVTNVCDVHNVFYSISCLFKSTMKYIFKNKGP